jgi:hypothetical protein
MDGKLLIPRINKSTFSATGLNLKSVHDVDGVGAPLFSWLSGAAVLVYRRRRRLFGLHHVRIHVFMFAHIRAGFSITPSLFVSNLTLALWLDPNLVVSTCIKRMMKRKVQYSRHHVRRWFLR